MDVQRVVCLLIALLCALPASSSESAIVALEANQFFISPASQESIEQGRAGSESPDKFANQVQSKSFTSFANQHIDNSLLTGVSNIEPAIIKSPIHSTQKITTESTCHPHVQNALDDIWAIICLSADDALLTNQDQQNFEIFSQVAERVELKIFSLQPEATKKSVTHWLADDGITDVSTETIQLSCSTCSPYVLLRSLPFK